MDKRRLLWGLGLGALPLMILLFIHFWFIALVVLILGSAIVAQFMRKPSPIVTQPSVAQPSIEAEQPAAERPSYELGYQAYQPYQPASAVSQYAPGPGFVGEPQPHDDRPGAAVYEQPLIQHPEQS